METMGDIKNLVVTPESSTIGVGMHLHQSPIQRSNRNHSQYSNVSLELDIL